MLFQYTDAEEGTEDTSKQRGKCWCSAAVFHPACENVTMQATNKTDLLIAGKLSHAAADTAVGTSLESERCARITQDQTFLFGRDDVPSPCPLLLSPTSSAN